MPPCVICGQPVTKTSDGRITQTCRAPECVSAVRRKAARARALRQAKALRRRTTKMCRVCGETLPLTSEHFDRKRQNGEMVWGPHKPCRRVNQRLAYELNEELRQRVLDRNAARYEAQRARAQEDSSFAEEWRAQRRGYRDRSQRGRRGIQDPSPVDHERSGVVPVGPFVTWLEETYAERDLADMTFDQFCEALSLSARNVGRMRSGKQQTVMIDTVDRALVAEGSTTLRALYPEVYGVFA